MALRGLVRVGFVKERQGCRVEKGLPSPGAKDCVPRNGCDAFPFNADEFAFVQTGERVLHAAFGETDILGDVSQGNLHSCSALAMRHSPEKEIDQECRWLAIMPDEAAHERIKNVIIDLEH